MNNNDETLIRAMISQSGKMWGESLDRSFGSRTSAVVICRDPERAFYLELAENYKANPANIDGWIVEERPLRAADAADFFASFGNHWFCWLGAIVKDAPLRAYIKDGRREGWAISLDIPSEALAKCV